MASESAPGPVQARVESRLRDAFSPLYLEVVNDSYKHSVPKGSESHFSVIIVSDAFTGKKLLERHRMVNEVLAEELRTALHALSIKAIPPEKWSGSTVDHSTPNCLGGSKADK